MASIPNILSILLHLDLFLAQIVHMMGYWSYALLFMIIFLERGCVLTPFLPGDSLLFAAGAVAANSELQIGVLMFFLVTACFTGTLVNYWLGHKFGDYWCDHFHSRWINRAHLKKTHDFFEKYGVSALIISCFVPVVRTFAPFVAGMAVMNHSRYVLVSFLSSFIWIIGILWASYAFGHVSFIKQNFSWFVLGMIIIPSIIPVAAYLFKKNS